MATSVQDLLPPEISGFWKILRYYVNFLGSRLGQGWVKVGSRLGQGWVEVGSRLGQGWVKVGSRLGQGWVKVGSRLGQGVLLN